MHLYLVVGGDRGENRVDVIGVYTTQEAAVQATKDAYSIVKDNEWFGCQITCIKVDDPLRMPWELRPFNGHRSIPKKDVCPVG